MMVTIVCLLSFGGFVSFVSAASFTVNSTDDASDGSCDQPFLSEDLDCTLREAIQSANGNSGVDNISFSIDSSFADDGSGQWEIAFETAIPDVTDPIVLSAADLWDVDNSRPGIHLTGAGTNAFVFEVGSMGSRIQGLTISGFSNAVTVRDADVTIGTDCDGAYDGLERNVIYNSNVFDVRIEEASDAVIRGNYLGVREDGVTAESVSGSDSVNVFGAGSDRAVIGYAEGTSSACSASLQRNVIGSTGDAGGIRIESNAGNVDNGDAALAPDGVRISGNYIGVGADGVSDIAGAGSGIDVRRGATQNTIGDDGDGTDDDLEGNLVANWGVNGVLVFRTGFNRVAGNTILENTLHGVLLRGMQNSLEGNTIGQNVGNGIRLGAGCNGCLAYGNFVGTDAFGNDLGNGEAGIYVHPGLSDVRIGGPLSGEGNTVSFNDAGGVVIDGLFCFGSACAGPREPTTNFFVEGNTVANNDSFGIQVLGTDVSSSGNPGTGTVQNNIVQDNMGTGISLSATSPEVSGNTIDSNNSYGIEILSGYGDPHYVLPASDESGTYNPPETTISTPLINGNTVSDNQTGGIFVLNADPLNMVSLYADNTLSSNLLFAVRKDTFFSVNLSSPADTDLTDNAFTIRLRPSSGLACTGSCDTSSTAFASESNDTVWGPEGIVYSDPRTWFQVTDFSVDEDGARDDYGPYRVLVTGDVIAETYQVLETAENGDASTIGAVSVHYGSSSSLQSFLFPPTATPASSESESVPVVPLSSQIPQSADANDVRSESQPFPGSLESPLAVGGGIGVEIEPSVYFAQPFSFVKTSDRDTVYMIDLDQTRRLFVNVQIFLTWQDDFRFVRTISEVELNSIPLGPPMLPRPGTVLVKQASDARVYAVEPNMTLRWIPLESQVQELYGEDWTLRVLDVDPFLFSKYTIAWDPLDFHEYPSGLVVSDGTRLCQISFGWCDEVTENGFAANRFSKQFVRSVALESLKHLPTHHRIDKMEDGLLTERFAFL